MTILDAQRWIQELFPHWQTQSQRYKDLIKKNVTSKTTILDIGCGRTDFMMDLYRTVKYVIGQDTDTKAIAEHPYLHQRIVGDFDSLNALTDKSIDCIVSAWTFEHLQNPDDFCRQASRLLTDDGIIIALTPNKCGIPSIISRLIPNSLHPKIAHKLWGRTEENTYPAFYQFNSPKEISELCARHNLKVLNIQYLADPSYYIQREWMTTLVYKFHRLLPTRMHEGLLITIVPTQRERQITTGDILSS